MLSDNNKDMEYKAIEIDRLNAPFGARCFMTYELDEHWTALPVGLNAPFGARCFLTQQGE